MSTSYCINCGSALALEARFCPVCGASANTEATRLAPRSQQQPPPAASRPAQIEKEEETIFVARPTFLLIALGYLIAALAAILLTTVLAFAGLQAHISLLLTLPVFILPILSHIKRSAIRYRLTDSKIEIAQGILARTTRNVPLRSLQDVTVSRSVFQRLLGLGDIRLEDAGEGSGSTLLHNIPDPTGHADAILRQLRRPKLNN